MLGVSGGADSVSLFFVMLALYEKYNIEIVVVHVNHGIRGEEAKRDEDFVKELCRQHQVICECVHLDIKKMARAQKLSEEEMGRIARYDAFSKVSEKYNCNKIAVAHNQNDVSETVLLNLFRGSGLKGLIGMEPVRGNLIRPLLCVERKEIEQFLLERGISYQNDATNFETEYMRNRIRLKVIPYVEDEVNERASWHIAKTAGIIAQVYDFIEQESRKLYEETVQEKDAEYWILLEPFRNAHVALKKEVIRKILFAIAKKQKDIEQSHVEMVLDLAEKGAGKRISLPYEMEAIHQYDKIVLRERKKRGNESNGFELEALVPGKLVIPGTDKSISFELVTVTDENRKELENLYVNKKNDYTKWFDYDRIRNTILVRNRKTGDYFECNSDGSRKKLKKFFIDNKLPSEKRDGIVLLADGNHIMWIIGYRISEYYKVQNDTKKILKVKVDGGNEDD